MALLQDLEDAGLLQFAADVGCLDHFAQGADVLQGAEPCNEQQQQQQMAATVMDDTGIETAVALAKAAVEATRDKLQQVASGMSVSLTPVGSSTVGPGPSRSRSQAGAGKNKGLKQYGLMVCEAVESKVRTTYHELADNLVADLSAADSSIGKNDVQNIKRRVYDAINVLMAVGIIEKRDNKEVAWRGFPDTYTRQAPANNKLRAERQHLFNEVDRKQQYLQELIKQHAALKHLMAHTAEQQQLQQQQQAPPAGTALHLPFIVIQAKPDAQVGVNISPDMLDVSFDFYDCPFKVHDDSFVLQQLAAQQLSTAGTAMHQEMGEDQQPQHTMGPAQPCSGQPAAAYPHQQPRLPGDQQLPMLYKQPGAQKESPLPQSTTCSNRPQQMSGATGSGPGWAPSGTAAVAAATSARDEAMAAADAAAVAATAMLGAPCYASMPLLSPSLQQAFMV